MNEKVFNLGYTTYLKKNKETKMKWTSKIVNLFNKHRILAMCLIIVIMCLGMNLLLICNFMRIIEQSNIF